MKTKTKVMIAAGAAVGAAAGYYGICELAYNRFIRRGPKFFAMGPQEEAFSEPQRTNRQLRQEAVQQWFVNSQVLDLTLTSFDGLRLHATQILNHPESEKWIVMAHGYGADSLALLPRAKTLDEAGFNIVLPDLRGHGLSEGDYVGMGWNDRRDLILWTDRIAQEHPESKIVLFGMSMGASAVMMACGEEDLNDHVVCAIEDCGYTSVPAIAEKQVRQAFGIATQPVLIGLSTLIKMRCGYSVWQASAVEQLKQCRVPMMFIHGEEDDFVPYDMVFENYYACASEKELYTVPSAGHCEAYHSPHYDERLFRFIRRFLHSDLNRG